MKKSKHGGKRKGSGRKKIDDPKTGVTLQIRESLIAKIGSKKQVREIAENYLSSL